MPITHHNGTEREMTPNEIAEYEATIAAHQIEKDAAAALAAEKQAARIDVLTKLGLTEAEIELLLS